MVVGGWECALPPDPLAMLSATARAVKMPADGVRLIPLLMGLREEGTGMGERVCSCGFAGGGGAVGVGDAVS